MSALTIVLPVIALLAGCALSLQAPPLPQDHPASVSAVESPLPGAPSALQALPPERAPMGEEKHHGHH